MDRREFLKHIGGAAVATSVVLSACKSEGDETPIAKNVIDGQGEMTYRTNPNTGDKVSLLGYGMMRLPVEEGGTLRDDCKSFYEEMVNEFSTTAPEEVMEFMSQEEPIEENYTDPDCIFYNNPGAVKEVIQGIKNCHELFKQNPGYTEEYGKQIEAMIERISTHL